MQFLKVLDDRQALRDKFPIVQFQHRQSTLWVARQVLGAVLFTLSEIDQLHVDRDAFLARIDKHSSGVRRDGEIVKFQGLLAVCMGSP